MEQLPKIVRDRLGLKTSQPDVHPDANLLTAFVEKSLRESERVQVLEHLALCRECRETLMLTQADMAEVLAGQARVPAAVETYHFVGHLDSAVSTGSAMLPRVESGLQPQSRRRWLGWRTLRWGALAACVLAVAAVITAPKLYRAAPSAYSGEIKAPAEKPLDQQAAANNRQAVVRPSQSMAKTEERDQINALDSPQSKEVIVGKAVEDREEQARAGTRGTIGGMKEQPASHVPARSENELALGSYERVVPSAPPPSAHAGTLDKMAGAQVNKKEASPSSASAPAVGSVKPEAQSAGMAEYAKSVPAPTTPTSDSKKDEPKAKLADAPVFNSAVAQKSVTAETDFRLRRDEGLLRKTWPRWTVGTDGSLQNSYDAGKTWARVSVGQVGMTFHAVAMIGPEVWAGGSKGALFHSADSGQNWTRVIPSVNGAVLADDIVSINFADAQHGKLITAKHETWSTTDGGKSWTRL